MKREDLEVRDSRIHGRGVFARRAVPAKRKVGEFMGELITVTEARRRAKDAPVVYIVEFEDNTALDVSTDECLRFVNHSCGPNTCLRRIGHRLELHSLRKIRAGEELTCDYGETHHNGTLPCRCGSEQCREKI